MPQIALHNMEWDAVVQKLCSTGVSQPVGLAESQRVSGRIGQSVQLVELA
jgi:hypothetical protein